jgi:predicted  nucleic acid-binding Zn-ribbon protein
MLETQIAELQQSETERIASVESSYPEPTDGSEAALALARQLRQSAISEETEVIKRQTAEEIAALQAQLEEHALNLALQNSGQLAQSRLTRRLDLSREIQEADQCAERLSEEITNLGQMADELKEQLSALAKEAEPLFPELEELRQTFNARIDELFALLRGTTGA